MSKEAMKLALDTLETELDLYRENSEDGAPDYILDTITALREALAEQPAQNCVACEGKPRFPNSPCTLCGCKAEQPAQQEPVAWVLLRQDEDGFEPIQFYGGKQKPEGDFKDRFTLRPVCFADATPPAQRTWVGLTEVEKKHIENRDFMYGVEWAEAKLREKNA